MQLVSLLALAIPSRAAQSNLVLGMTATPSPATVNELITWRLSITNLGPDTANNVVVTNWLPTSATLFSATVSQGTLTTNGGFLRLALGPLASFARATGEVTLFSGTSGNFTNRARVVSSSTDSQPNNNFATNAVAVVPDRFQMTGEMNLPRYWHSATLLQNGKVLITGGRNAYGNTSACELYDPVTGTFSLTGNTIGTRVLHKAVVLTNGRVLVVGGVPFTPEIYDPVTGTWASTAPMVFARNGGHAMSVLNDGRVLVTGGFGTWTNAEIYNPAANAWTAVAPMSARQDHTSVTLTNGRVLIVGGYSSGTNAEAFVPATGSFVAAGGVLLSRASEATVCLNDNNVLMAGGYTGFGSDPKWAELYSPLTQTSVSLGDLVTPRWDFPGVLLNDGRVLLVGGATAYVGYWAGTANAEIFNRTNESFAPTIAMNSPRRNHTATRLADGRVLITGGYNSTATGDVLYASAEIYDPARAKSPPMISIADVSALEGNFPSNTLTFKTTLSSPMGVPVSVNFQVTSGSAQWGSDFQTESGTVIFAPGTTNQPITILGVGDSTCEPDEFFTVVLSNPTNAVLARVHSAVGTLLNDDPLPVINVSSPATAESNLLTAQLEFAVTLSNPSQQDLQVNFATANGTATAGSDYQTQSGVLVFTAGTTTQTVAVVVNGDIAPEPNETLQLLLSAPVNGVIGTHGTGTILDDDGLPGRVDHFDFSSIPSPQYYQVPFPLTITARDLAGALVTSFNGPVLLRTQSNSAPSFHFGLEQDSATNWLSVVNPAWPFHSGGHSLEAYDVTGHGVVSKSLHLYPYYEWDYGVARALTLVGGVTYAVRVDAAQDNGITDRFFDYTLSFGTNILAQVPMNSLGLPHGQVDRRAVSGVFTAPSNGTYTLTFMLSGIGSAYNSRIYLDNLRVEPGGVSPSIVIFTNGAWTGPVQISGVGASLVLQTLDQEGHAGLSNPFEVLPTADVGVENLFSFSSSPETFQEFSLQCYITNHGLITATAVLFTNVLPAGFQLLSASTTGGQLTTGGNTVACALYALPTNHPVCVTILARTGGEGFFTNHATVTAADVDHDSGNNVVVTPLTVLPPRVFVSGHTITESPGGTGVVFTVWLSSSNDAPASLDYATAAGSAQDGLDFLPVSGSLGFAPGVRTQWVTVTVLDDSLNESNEVFTLALANSSHARLAAPAAGPAIILDDDAPPTFTLEDGAVAEGDSGFATLGFPFHLSAPSGKSIVAGYATSNGTAVAGIDYVAGFGSLTIPAGQTSGVISISVLGDTVNEPDETLFLLLTNVLQATSARTVALGVIQNDDAVPGKFDHLAFDPIPPLRLTNAPFRITIRAMDYLGTPITNSPASVLLSASNAPSSSLLTVSPNVLTNFTNGAWSGFIAIPNLVTNVALHAKDGQGRIGLSGRFNMVAQYAAFLRLPPDAPEGSSVIPGGGIISVATTNDVDVVFMLASTDLSELLVPTTVVLPAGQTNVAFDLTVVDDALLDGSIVVTVTGSAPGYSVAPAGLSVLDNEPAQVTVVLPSGLSEAPGSNIGSGGAYFSRPADQNAVLYLYSSHPSRLLPQGSVWLDAGSTSAVFGLTVPNNAIIDGPQAVTITARLSAWAEGSETTVVQDDDTNITVFVNLGNDLPLEGSGTKTNSLTIRLGGVTPQAVTVQLLASHPQKTGVPELVNIPAGQQSVTTNLTLLDDALYDGNTSVTITASAPGFLPGTRTFTVYDNDVHHFALATIPTPQTSGVPFTVSFSVRDVNNATMTFFRGSVGLTARRDGTLLPMTPTVVSNLSRGSWNGPVTINGWGTNAQLFLTAPGCTNQVSNPFNLAPPVWAGSVRLKEISLTNAAVRLRFDTLSNQIYLLEFATNLFPADWVRLGPARLGTGFETNVVEPVQAWPDARFYRIRVTP